MPVYQYEGVHYDLPEGLSNDQAISKIQSHLGIAAKPKLPAQTGEATPESMVADPSNPFSYLGQEQQTAQGPAMQAVGQGVNRALQIGAGVAKGAVINPVAAVAQLTGTDTGQQFASEAQKAYAQQRAGAGATGYDFAELGGAIVSPVNRLLPAATATTGVARAGQYAGQGAILGALTPVEDAQNLLSEKIKQVGLSAVMGGVLSGALDLGKGAYNIAKEFAKPLTTAGQKAILQERLVELAGKEPSQIISALRTAPEIIPGSKPTAAEAMSAIPEATGLAAYQKSLETLPKKGISSDFAVRDFAQQAARKQALQKTGGTEADILEAIAARTQATAPLRESALGQANIAGELVPRLEQQIAEKFQSKAGALKVGGTLETQAAQLMRPTAPITDFERRIAEATGKQIPEGSFRQGASFYPVEGMPRVPVSYRPELNKDFVNVLSNLEGAAASKNIAAQRQAEGEFKKLQLDSLAAEGFYPLRIQPIINNIDAVLNKPGERASDVVTNVFGSLKEKLTRFTNPTTGVIDSRDLYTIRKEIGNDIKKFSAESQNWDAKLTSGLEKNVKSYIDNAIEKAGNSGDWQKYLTTFQEQSTKINQMQIAQALEKQLGTPLGNKERAAAFAAAVENGANIIKRSTGQNRFQKLDEVLTPKQMSDINTVLADVQRKAQAEELASFSKVAGQQTPELPTLLNRYATITNVVLKLLKKDATDDINRYAADMMLNPEKLAAFIEGVPKSKMQSIITAFMSRLTPETREAFSRRIILQPLVLQTQ